jgi:hypothetical protein
MSPSPEKPTRDVNGNPTCERCGGPLANVAPTPSHPPRYMCTDQHGINFRLAPVADKTADEGGHS